jgi:MYXO-CTERM domain-containing protein
VRATVRRPWRIVILLLASAAGRPALAKATFVIDVTDGAGVGFNDTTPATPVGGNPGTTVGEQRKLVFQAAADAWGRVLDSSVPITVEASFAPLDCLGGGAVTGQAAPYSVSNYPGLPTTGKYVLALANKLLGKDISATNPDIVAQFNGGLMACMGVDWYYGLDGQKNSEQSDLLSTVMHELGHGLGFTTDVDVETGTTTGAYPMAFDSYVRDVSTGKHWSEMTAAERVASLTNPWKLAWDGERVRAVAAWALAKGLPSVETSPALSGLSGIIGEANYGRLVADGSAVTGSLASGTVSASCNVSGSFSGKIALFISPTNCASIGAAQIVEKSGGLAMLFAYDVADTPPPRPLEFSTEELALYPVKIPTLAVTRDDATLLRNTSSTTVTLSADSSRLVGTDDAGNTLLFASNPIQPGSTGAHWDPLVRPNLLLEPSEQPLVVSDLVMERALLWDIGWTGACGDGAVGGQEECDDGARNSDRTKDACRLDCTKPRCGDGVVDSGEECDPGQAGVGTVADANCTGDCHFKSPPGTGGTGAGGASGQGGTTSSSGGGGDSSTGGTSGFGGAGGNSGSGGADSGGNSGSGGASDNGGASGTGSGGATMTGGGSSGGCGCHTAPAAPGTPLALLAVGLALALRRRAKRRR